MQLQLSVLGWLGGAFLLAIADRSRKKHLAPATKKLHTSRSRVFIDLHAQLKVFLCLNHARIARSPEPRILPWLRTICLSRHHNYHILLQVFRLQGWALFYIRADVKALVTGIITKCSPNSTESGLTEASGSFSGCIMFIQPKTSLPNCTHS